jgi:hypothetical protein
MTFDGNPEPVQFIQPNVHHRAGFSVGKHDGLADQFGLRRTVLIQNIDARRFTDGIARPCQPSRLCCPKQLNGDACPDAQPLESLMVTALPIRGAGQFAF